ncbi:hypothetical protein Tco_0814390 [Tanacetum coccineum]
MLLQNCNMKKDSDIKLKDVNKRFMNTSIWVENDNSFEKGFDKFCKKNSRSEVDNDMSNDFWKNFNPREEWKMWETEKTNPSNDRHGNIRSYELIITKEDDDWMMD